MDLRTTQAPLKLLTLSRPFWLTVAGLLLLSSWQTQAEFYRYQDENGKWHFTDKKPSEQVDSESFSYQKKQDNDGEDDADLDDEDDAYDSDIADEDAEDNTGSDNREDLAQLLHDKAKPQTDIEKATLSVMKIVTSAGSGSGFFVSDDGFIITNKHVVRPTQMDDWDKTQEKMEQYENNIEQWGRDLEQRKRNLNDFKRNLESYKQDMENAHPSEKEEMEKTYRYQSKRYKDSIKEYNKLKKQRKEVQKEFADYKRKISASRIEKRFEIVLKNDVKKRAKLIKVSRDEDLALLKIIGDYSTPYLQVGSDNDAIQGSEVYAIGSPLGMDDFVTKGIITRREKDKIITDTQILPGNSGGPLTTPEGKVLGVNTAVLRATHSLGSELFGQAIPANVVKREFGAYIKSHSSQ